MPFCYITLIRPVVRLVDVGLDHNCGHRVHSFLRMPNFKLGVYRVLVHAEAGETMDESLVVCRSSRTRATWRTNRNTPGPTGW